MEIGVLGRALGPLLTVGTHSTDLLGQGVKDAGHFVLSSLFTLLHDVHVIVGHSLVPSPCDGVVVLVDTKRIKNLPVGLESLVDLVLLSSFSEHFSGEELTSGMRESGRLSSLVLVQGS